MSAPQGLDEADIRAVYNFFAKVAVDHFNEHGEHQPMLMAAQCVDETIEQFAIIDPRLVFTMHESPNGKALLGRFIRAMLSEAGIELLQALPGAPGNFFPPNAMVHVSEVWIVSVTSEEERHSGIPPSEDPRRHEALSILVHTVDGSSGGTCPIERTEGHVRAVFEPLHEIGNAVGRIAMRDGDAPH